MIFPLPFSIQPKLICMLSFLLHLQLKNLIRQSIGFFLVILFPVFSITAQQSKTANFVVAKNPLSLTIFNKYQQRLSSDQLKIFPVGIPFQILKENELLSDGYTKSIKVLYENNLYFIGKGDNRKSPPEFLKFQNALIFYDTVEVTVSNRLFFNSRNQSQSSVYLQKGNLLLRIFKDGQFIYAKKLTDGNQFGWIPKAGNYLEKYNSFKNKTVYKNGIPGFLVSSVERKINVINDKIGKLYSVYNQKENKKLPLPNLRLETQGNKLICSFTNLPELNAFAGTQKYILNELETVFLGSGYKISKTDIGFEISK